MNQNGSLNDTNPIIPNTATITGNVIVGSIQGSVITDYDISGKVIVDGIIRKEVILPYYDGDYTVVPNVSEQILNTSQKSMASDLTVDAIPYYETSNPKGGYTVIIGG